MKRYEPFKESAKSICRKCFNVENDCFYAIKTCSTDAKIGKSYVEKCGSFNKELIQKEYEKAAVTVANAADSRIEMMGGGYKE